MPQVRRSTSIVIAMVFGGCAPKTDVARPDSTSASAGPAAAPIPYGANAAASGTFTHDGVKLYYETYGQGEPLLIIHGNGGSIGTMAAQIDYFKAKYQVIAMDSRDHGRSADSPGAITYEVMTDDLAALLDQLRVGPAYVFGWSDGGVEALLLGLRHPTKVKMIAAGAANLNPSDRALHPAAVKLIGEMIASLPDSLKRTPEGRRQDKVLRMMVNHPNIAPTMLEKISAPTLVMAGDQDLILDQHTLEIFNHLPLAQLAIFPNATHLIMFEDPATLNNTVARFFSTPFTREKDRVTDMMASYEKLLAGLPK